MQETIDMTELKKKTVIIKQEVYYVYTFLREQFHSTTLIRLVKQRLPSDYGEKKHTLDSTILRRLRQLRQEGKINYKVISHLDGLYEKIPPKLVLETKDDLPF